MAALKQTQKKIQNGEELQCSDDEPVQCFSIFVLQMNRMTSAFTQAFFLILYHFSQKPRTMPFAHTNP